MKVIHKTRFRIDKRSKADRELLRRIGEKHSVRGLAEVLGYSHVNVGQWLSGRLSMPYEVVNKIRELAELPPVTLNVSVSGADMEDKK